MRLMLLVVSLVSLTTMVSVLAKGMFEFVDIQPKANHPLNKNLHNDNETGNDLSELPKGEQTFASVKFKIGKAAMQLGSNVFDRPLKIAGIKVGTKATKLHFLHSTGFGNAPVSNPAHVRDGTTIGYYRVEYEDKTAKVVPIVYGVDVRDWWGGKQDGDLSRGKLAWKGSNERAREAGAVIKLYLTSWDNPFPDKLITSIDFVSPGDCAAAPFCVAISTEN